jgi:pimeloyl-ACP methyl ester carboxylesterase
MTDNLKMRVHGDASLPTLVYLPGLHGDWTLVSSFRAAIAGRVRFVEFTYPRTTTWSLDDYAREIEEKLLAHGIERGWLLGESFGSLPAWQVVKRFWERKCANESSKSGLGPCKGEEHHQERSTKFPSWEGLGVGFPATKVGESVGFLTQGLILSGGFVRHPVIWAVRMAGRVSGAIPMGCVKLFCGIYARYAQFRHKRAPETLATIAEFVANRTMEADRQAIVHRYTLIAESDLRPVARQTRFPVLYLAGLVDPLVPWCYVRWWLGRNCPGYRGGRTMWRADHNVLGTAPQKSAEQIHAWISNASLPADDVELTHDHSRKTANRFF